MDNIPKNFDHNIKIFEYNLENIWMILNIFLIVTSKIFRTSSRKYLDDSKKFGLYHSSEYKF